MLARAIPFFFIIFFAFANVANAEEDDFGSYAHLIDIAYNFSELVKEYKLTETPGEDLAKLNKDFNGRTESSPPDSDIGENSRIKIWIKYNGYSEQVFEDGIFWRSDKAYPLIQYGYEKKSTTYSVSDDLDYVVDEVNNVITITYVVDYRYKVKSWYQVCDDSGACSWKWKWKKKSGSKTITKTYPILGIHPSCNITNANMTLHKGKTSTVIHTGDNPVFKYNYEIFLTRNYLDDEPQAKVKNVVFKIISGKPAYYAVPIEIDPPICSGFGIAKKTDPESKSVDLVADPTVSFKSLNYIDVFGYHHEINTASIKSISSNDEDMFGNIMVACLFMLLVINVLSRLIGHTAYGGYFNIYTIMR